MERCDGAIGILVGQLILPLVPFVSFPLLQSFSCQTTLFPPCNPFIFFFVGQPAESHSHSRSVPGGFRGVELPFLGPAMSEEISEDA